MLYRSGKIKCRAGKADEVPYYFRKNENTFNNTKGIQSLSYFKSDNDEVIGVATWGGRENLDVNAERVQSMISGLNEYTISPPEISEGILE